MRLNLQKTLLSVALLPLAGCSTFGIGSEPNNLVLSASTPGVNDTAITARLAEAAQRTATAVESLASVEQARTPELYTPVVTNAPPELRLMVTVQWSGPWENFLKAMAQRVNYEFRTIGKAPIVPIVVTVDAQQQPFVDVMRSVGLQAAGRADLVLDSQNKVIEARYAPDTGR